MSEVGREVGAGAAPGRAGSWRPLLAVTAAFLVAFTALRSTSDFLAIEADAPAARLALGDLDDRAVPVRDHGR